MAKAIPEGYHTATPYLIIKGAAAALDFYKQAFGATELFRMASPDGRIGHAEIRIGDSLIMLNDELGGGKSAKGMGGSPASLWVYVDDCDALFNRAVAAGGKVTPQGAMMDQFWGDRSGTFTDPHGYTWSIATHKEDLTPQEMKKRQDEFMKQFATKA